ncbi:MAG: DNA-directed RNA polymerase subunit L [Candidatus Bathyarchaeia archaeon]
MKLKILKQDGGFLELEIEGEGHTFCNALQDSLLKDEDVYLAGYTIPHPLEKKAILQVRMKGEKNPLQALMRAADRLKADAQAFMEAFQKAYDERKP